MGDIAICLRMSGQEAKGNTEGEGIDMSDLKGWICEQFAYLPNKVVYPNSSDINELGEILGGLQNGER